MSHVRGGRVNGGKWAHYDKRGFTVAWCPFGDRYYWHVSHRQYGTRWGYELNARACHKMANWVIGDMRQGLMTALATGAQMVTCSATYANAGTAETSRCCPTGHP